AVYEVRGESPGTYPSFAASWRDEGLVRMEPAPLEYRFPRTPGITTLLLVAVLFPIAIYLSVLGWINRRARGLLISGPWDFAGILFAASGFLFLGGPTLLGTVMQTDLWRDFWVRTCGDEGASVGRVLLFGLYFLVVVGV